MLNGVSGVNLGCKMVFKTSTTKLLVYRPIILKNLIYC